MFGFDPLRSGQPSASIGSAPQPCTLNHIELRATSVSAAWPPGCQDPAVAEVRVASGSLRYSGGVFCHLRKQNEPALYSS